MIHSTDAKLYSSFYKYKESYFWPHSCRARQNINMTYKYTNAFIRKLNKSIYNGISSRFLRPSYEKILEIHKNYINAIEEAGLNIILLNNLEQFPDSIFVEDPALIYKKNIIILNPSDQTRNGEAKIIKNEIGKYFEKILTVEKGTIEGGDILNLNNHFIIGLSNRTNKLGAENLSNILISLGATVEVCQTPKDILHFKSECSLIDDDLILVSNKMSKLDYLRKNYNLIELPSGEENAANCIRINHKLLIPDGFTKTEEILSKNFNIIKINVEELLKVDAGLSCMSLRW